MKDNELTHCAVVYFNTIQINYPTKNHNRSKRTQKIAIAAGIATRHKTQTRSDSSTFSDNLKHWLYVSTHPISSTHHLFVVSGLVVTVISLMSNSFRPHISRSRKNRFWPTSSRKSRMMLVLWRKGPIHLVREFELGTICPAKNNRMNME